MTGFQKDEKTHEVPGNDSGGGGLGIRHMQVAVMAMAAFIGYSMRANLSIAIVAMTIKLDENSTHSELLAPTYEWDEGTKGYVLSSFFWGYLLAQIPAGALSARYGGHRFLCGGILGTSLLTLLFPISAYTGDWMLVCANRMLQGVSQGLIFPSIFSLLGVWAPPKERSRLASVSVSAQLMGTVVSAPLSGYLCSAYGWPYVFYTLGAMGTCLGVIMIFLGADSPATLRMISHKERLYIETSLGGTKKAELSVPWKSIFKNPPYLSSVFAMAFKSSIYITFLAEIPTYLGTVLKFSMESNGFISALPFLTSWLVTFFFSWMCDLMTSRGWISLTAARKLFNSIGHFGAALGMILIAHSANRILSVILLTFTIACQAGVFVGVQAGFVDLSPNFAGAIFSVSNFASSSLGTFGPIAVGHIVSESGSTSQWRIVFYGCAMLLTMSNIVYLIWGSAETQWWNWPDRYTSKQDYEEKKKEKEELERSAC